MEEYDIYVPQSDNSGKKYSSALISGPRVELVDHFGGLTETRYTNEGIWKIRGIEVHDEIAIWRVIGSEPDKDRVFLKTLKLTLEKVLAQKEILITARRISVIG